MDIRIDYSRFTRAENEEVARQIDPKRELRQVSDLERSPDYFQRQQEREGRSEWSGGNWAGRSR